jgi:hypothetical protein
MYVENKHKDIFHLCSVKLLTIDLYLQNKHISTNERYKTAKKKLYVLQILKNFPLFECFHNLVMTFLLRSVATIIKVWILL